MIIDSCKIIISNFETSVLMISAALAAISVGILLLSATTSVFAAQFSFDPLSGKAARQADPVIPASIIAIGALAGAFVIVLERRKAKGIWFSDNERLK
jgi:hypothetical protein